MTSLIYIFFPLTLLASSFLSQCNSEDEIAPVIQNIELNDQQESIEIQANDTLKFEAKFTDNINLTDYQLEISPGFENTTTGRVSIYPFEFKKTYNLGGISTLAHSLIPIPYYAAEGNYTLKVYYEDKAGNKGNTITKSFKIKNGAPLITMDQPGQEDVSAQPGDTLNIEGKVKSFGVNLYGIAFLMGKPPIENVDELALNKILTAEKGDISGNFHQFQVKHPISPQDTGQFKLSVEAIDQNGKFTSIPTNVFILE